MRLIKLTISDSCYTKALTLAAAHGIPLEAYLSGQVADILDKSPPSSGDNGIGCPASNKPTSPRPSSSSVMPSTLRQVLDVCSYVYEAGNVPNDDVQARLKFRDAVRDVASDWKIGETSVRDKCGTTRRLGLPDVPVNTDTFIVWLCKPELLRDHLCRKFPNCIPEIHKHFADFLPGKFGGAD